MEVTEILSRHPEVSKAFARFNHQIGEKRHGVDVVMIVPPMEIYRELYGEPGSLRMIARDLEQAGIPLGSAETGRLHLTAISAAQSGDDARFWESIKRESTPLPLSSIRS